MTETFVLPTEIPWDKMIGKDLEESLYWLVIAMGGKDVEWRVGGTGAGAMDGGRDLEVRFYMPGPDGEVTRQKWWIEAKGRSATLEPSAVKESVVNTAAMSDLDVLVIATNSTFSNPTRDWVKQWQESHARLLVRLWDRNNLEKLLSQHPDVVVRLYAEALSPQGRLEMARSRFWNYCAYSDWPALRYLWNNRENVEWSDAAIVAALVSEVANGKITRRPWAVNLEAGEILPVLEFGFLNLVYFCSRARSAGIDEGPYIRGMAYLLLAALDKFDGGTVYDNVIQRVWADKPSDIRRIVITPVLQQLAIELQDVCTSDCTRVSSDLVSLDSEEVTQYWDRLSIADKSDQEEEEGKRILQFEHFKEPCQIGFDLDMLRLCPILRLSERALDFKNTLDVLEQIVRRRRPKGSGP